MEHKRIGMDKNMRVGKVKRVSDDRTKILVDVVEMCRQEDGGMYVSNYNIWLHFDRMWKGTVTKNLTGRFVVVGFYIQSFRNKDMSDVFESVLTCRFLNEIPSEEVIPLSICLMESKLFVDHHYLKLSNIKLNQ